MLILWEKHVEFVRKLQFKGIARKGPKFRGGPTEPQMRWNFVLHSLRRLLFPLRPKLTRCARSDKGLRGNAMLAHEENSNASAILYALPETSALLTILR